MKKFLLIPSFCSFLIFLCACSLFLSPDNKNSSSTQTDFNKNINMKNHSIKLTVNKSVTIDAKLNIPKQLSSFQMNKVNLELAPVFIKDNNYEIRPVWSFKGQTSSSSSEIEVLFDGITGKELIQ